MDPFLSDRHARWHPVGLSLFPLRPPPLRLSILTRSLTLPRLAGILLARDPGPHDSTRSAGFLFWLLDARSSSAVKGSPQACPVKSGILAINAAFE